METVKMNWDDLDIPVANKRRVCYHCHGQHDIETRTSRLGPCCYKCAERDRCAKIVKIELPCVICAINILSPENEVTENNASRLSFDNGMATTISYGYGCELDGNVYMIAICQECTEKKQKEGLLVYVYNYIHSNTQGTE